MLDEKDILKIAQELIKAEDKRSPIEPISERYDLTIEDAYKIQLKVIEMKKQRGERIIGKKIGLTSKRMQEALGVYQPDYGHITDRMIIEEGFPIRLSELIQPKIEVEIAFILKKDLEGPGITVADVLSATKGVIPAFEIIDSRIKNWKIKIQDTIADNASIGRVILGSPMKDVFGLDLRTVGVVVRKNGEIVQTAAGAAVLGNPANAVAWLANKLSEYGIALKKGELILSGSLVAAINIKEGDVIQAEFGDGLGSVTAYVDE
ncbi:2-keto-4-pentenoate hydratase [Thermococcus sp. LS2]|uniref:2-keto-4-pentenoate hydratase n=1 Tax=Thermococcus sp. LS2 TaxID=1638260 RepID=UPI00143A90E4|nr:fumarylacetoacetate hydrolase family protein [Thermococcus sp. LS2]NJE13156.1 2-keto-4-pentenoate hydratase [Thermococcus sp. LS2]